MESQNIKTRLSEHLAEITVCLERINKDNLSHPLDKDLLLDKIKDLYCDALKLGCTDEKNVAELQVKPCETETPLTDKGVEALRNEEAAPATNDEQAEESEQPLQYEKPESTEQPEIESESNSEPIAPMYGPIPEVFNEVQPEAIVEEEEPEPTSEPEPDPMTNRKNTIEDLVAQQQTTTSETNDETTITEPQYEEQHNDSDSNTEDQPQLSLLDYLNSGVSRVVEKVDLQTSTPAPTTPITENQPQTDNLNVSTNTPPQNPDPVFTNIQKFTDLRSIIGINDKFTFINDLFEKDMRSYNEFINSLNKIEDIDEAQNFVQSFAYKYSWDKESMAMQLFASVYKRRYDTTLNLV